MEKKEAIKIMNKVLFVWMKYIEWVNSLDEKLEYWKNQKKTLPWKSKKYVSWIIAGLECAKRCFIN